MDRRSAGGELLPRQLRRQLWGLDFDAAVSGPQQPMAGRHGDAAVPGFHTEGTVILTEGDRLKAAIKIDDLRP